MPKKRPIPEGGARPSASQRRRSRWIGRAFIILWVVAVVAIYIVIVQLKLGGERALRLPEPTPPPAQTAPTP